MNCTSITSDCIPLVAQQVNPAPTPFQLLRKLTAQWTQESQPFTGAEYQPIVAVSAALAKCC